MLTAGRTDVIGNLIQGPHVSLTLYVTPDIIPTSRDRSGPAGTEGGSRAAVRPNEVTGCAEYRLATGADALCSAASDLVFLFF